MDSETLESLSVPEAQAAAQRSFAWGALSECFEYPDAELLEAIGSGVLAGRLREVMAATDPGIVDTVDWKNLEQAGDDDDALQVEYTRLFDVGASGPPCALYGGVYGSARMASMEEAVRFYNHFGLSMSEDPRELPDHLSTQVEFLHFLCFREAELLEKGEDASSFQRAQRDFIARNPGKWIPKMLAKLEGEAPMVYFLELARLFDRFLKREQERLVALVGKAPLAAAGTLPVLNN